MGYFGAEQVPVFDHLAAHFCVCDAGHSSVPGATWPNRLYAVAGQADGSCDDRPHPRPPIYDKPSFIRHLDAAGVDWRWYSYDIGSLRAVDVGEYGPGHHEHFRWVDRLKLGIKTVLGRFCPTELDERSGTGEVIHWLEEGHPHYMGKRVASATDLGGLLTRTETRRAPNRRALAEWVAHRHVRRARALHEVAVASGKEVGLSDLQQGVFGFEAELHRRGHPVGQP
jgi:hypothetical protein